MTDFLLNLLTMSLPYRLLSYYPFRRRLRFPWRVVLALIIISELAVRWQLFNVMENGGDDRILEFVLFPVCTAIFLTCVRVEMSKLIFFYLFVVDHIIIVRGLTVFVLARLFPGTPMLSMTGYLIHMGFFVATLPIILKLWSGTVKWMLEVNSPRLWRTIWIVPAFTTVVILGYTYHIESDFAGSFRFLFARVGLFACMFVVYYVLLQSLDTVRSQAVLEEKARSGAQMLALQRKQYELLAKRIEEIRTARHDLRQHLTLIQSYLDSGDKQALADYVTAYGKTLPSDTVELYCHNQAVNAIVAYYGEEAKKQGVTFETELDLPRRLFVAEPDLCVVVGNLLENALEALRWSGDGAFIRMQAKVRDGEELVLTMDNGPVPRPEFEDGMIVSAKHEGHGIGTQSVKRVADHYDGVVNFSWKDQVFYASVYLRGRAVK